MLKTSVSTLLQKEMDRADFIKHVGIGVVALTGASAVLKMLVVQPTSSNKQQASGNQASVYGRTTYGSAEAIR